MKITKLEYVAVKETERVSKTGKVSKRESKFIFRIRTADKWLLAREFDEVNLKEFAEVYSREQAQVRFPSLFATLGLDIPESVLSASETARAKISEREAKREARERETIENGRNKFMKRNAESGARRWDKLLEKYGIEGE